MKKSLILFLLIGIMLLTACSSDDKILNPYTEDINVHNGALNDFELNKAEGFASNLGVIDKDAPEYDKSYEIYSPIALLIDNTTGEVLVQKNAHDRAYPASITKVLTSMLAIKYGKTGTKRQVGNEIYFNEENVVTCAYRVGDDITFDIALHGALVRSGNDAAAFLATFVNESQEEFVQLMNEEAHKLGATNSNFVNPHGLNNEDHYTTAYDLYLIYKEALKYDYFRSAIAKYTYKNEFQRTTSYNTYRIPCEYNTTNPFFTGSATAPDHVRVLGGKSGYTEVAKRCYILHAEADNGHEYICVVLKADTSDLLAKDLMYLLNCIPQ